MNKCDLEKRFGNIAGILTSELNEEGFWTGELSPSALATAVAIVALKVGCSVPPRDKIARGIAWLADHVNEDGGFGDTPGSVSNVNTTLLCYAAFRFCTEGRPDMSTDRSPSLPPGMNIARAPDPGTVVAGMEHYLRTQQVDIRSAGVVENILGYYGKDYTFSVPILSMLVICGVLDPASVNRIPRLPFELVMLPSGLYSFFNLHVVSYAIPVLAAMGIYIFKQGSGTNPITGFIRKRAIGPVLRKLMVKMPESGGFLEAIPLTAFVSMCLVRSGFSNHRVVEEGTGFLMRLQRNDGSWPIDIDLSTWVTTLAIKAMDHHLSGILTGEQTGRLRSHLLGNQYSRPHLFNNAPPGGWGWTSHSGSVPDADDTAGAILALIITDDGEKEVETAVLRGCDWLAGLQNRDGGIPTFCRGWGLLPFDRSCADLTGHALLAWIKAIERFGAGMQIAGPDPAGRNESSTTRQSLKKQKTVIRKLKNHADAALRFLEKAQFPDGSWLPLWFGSQHTGDKTNPVYGTARVLTYLRDVVDCDHLDLGFLIRITPMVTAAGSYLASQQNDDGSFGPRKGLTGSIEETALAICALTKTDPAACDKAFDWLEQEYQSSGLRPAPVGLYFASLWYYEKMYPVIYYLEALRRAIPVRERSVR